MADQEHSEDYVAGYWAGVDSCRTHLPSAASDRLVEMASVLGMAQARFCSIIQICGSKRAFESDKIPEIRDVANAAGEDMAHFLSELRKARDDD